MRGTKQQQGQCNQELRKCLQNHSREHSEYQQTNYTIQKIRKHVPVARVLIKLVKYHQSKPLHDP